MITQEECEADLGQYMAPQRGSGMFCAIGKSSSGLVDACQVSCTKCCVLFLNGANF